MSPTEARLDLHGLALLLGYTYDYVSRDWRRMVAEGMPAPFTGDRRKPRWSRAAVEAWRDGVSPPVTGSQSSPQAANDAVAPEPAPVVNRLRAALGVRS